MQLVNNRNNARLKSQGLDQLNLNIDFHSEYSNRSQCTWNAASLGFTLLGTENDLLVARGGRHCVVDILELRKRDRERDREREMEL